MHTHYLITATLGASAQQITVVREVNPLSPSGDPFSPQSIMSALSSQVMAEGLIAPEGAGFVSYPATAFSKVKCEPFAPPPTPSVYPTEKKGIHRVK